MKRFYLLIILGFVSIISLGQNITDRFSSVDEAVGKTIYLYDVDSILEKYGPFVYIKPDNRFIKVTSPTVYSSFLPGKNKVISIEHNRNTDYLKIENSSNTYYFILNKKVPYTEYMRSVSFWDSTLERLRSEYKYVNTNNQQFAGNKADRLAGVFLPITWKRYIEPKFVSEPLVFEYEAGGKTYTTFYNSINEVYSSGSTESVQFLSDSLFAIQSNIWIAKELEEEKKYENDDKKPLNAFILHTKKAKEILTKLSKLFDEYDKQESDTWEFHIFKATKIVRPSSGDIVIPPLKNPSLSFGNPEYEYIGFILGEEVSIPGNEIRFTKLEDSDYLIMRGEKGADRRKIVAKQVDSLYTIQKLDSLSADLEAKQARLAENINKIENFYRAKKVFITGQEYSYGNGDQFGLQFKFYNCWSQMIKYIELRVNAYNRVDDLQADYFGNKSKDVRCIGPIEPGENATYNFNELFWDEYDVIHHLDLVRVKITFKDNTTVVYSTKAQVDTHRSNHYSLKDIGIDDWD